MTSLSKILLPVAIVAVFLGVAGMEICRKAVAEKPRAGFTRSIGEVVSAPPQGGKSDGDGLRPIRGLWEITTKLERESIARGLGDDPVALAKALNRLPEDEGRNHLNVCGEFISQMFQADGQTTGIEHFFLNLKPEFASFLFSGWLVELNSPKGNYDGFKSKKALLERLSLERGPSIKRKLLMVSGGRAASEILERADENGVTREEASFVVLGAQQQLHVAEGFSVLSLYMDRWPNGNEQVVNQSIASLLEKDSIAVSQLIPTIGPQEQRDTVVRAMIGWLLKKGDADSAATWASSLDNSEKDSKFKQRVISGAAK